MKGDPISFCKHIMLIKMKLEFNLVDGAVPLKAFCARERNELGMQRWRTIPVRSFVLLNLRITKQTIFFRFLCIFNVLKEN